MDNKYVVDLEDRVNSLETALETVQDLLIIKTIAYDGMEVVGMCGLRFKITFIDDCDRLLVIDKKELYGQHHLTPAEVVYSYICKLGNIVLDHKMHLKLEVMLKTLFSS